MKSNWKKIIENPEQCIGKVVEKHSGRPFKSLRKQNTVKAVIAHPIMEGEQAFTFEEDDTFVAVVQCRLV